MPELPAQRIDVLIVGAGPTGLALATQLQLFGITFRIIDRSTDRAHESRALAVQARTLELFQIVNLGDALTSLGRTSTRLVLHFGATVVGSLTLGDIGASDTRFPFILFVSQADTERLLGKHLAATRVAIERGPELIGFAMRDTEVDCVLRHADGREERLSASYLVGCDGAHSTVRKVAGFAFEGGTYAQDFVLGDIEADGPLERGAINSFIGGGGVAMFFPLGSPATWRVIAMRAARAGSRGQSAGTDDITSPLTLEELQEIVTPPTGGSVVVRDPVWLTHFRLHHRQIERYRQGRVFLAGDAAHIHSPVGAQGMNTGVQDAWNLGWKLAFVLRGIAQPALLETYNAERWPVGNFLLRYTDRLFSTFTRVLSPGRIATFARKIVVGRVVPLVLRSRRLRAAAFRFVSELGIDYRESPAVVEGLPRLRHGVRAGHRLPDLRVTWNGEHTWLQQMVVGPFLSILLCGDPALWDSDRITDLVAGRSAWLRCFQLTKYAMNDVLVDSDDRADTLLGSGEGAQFLVRPDGYIAFRCGGRDFDALERYIAEWFAGPDAVIR